MIESYIAIEGPIGVGKTSLAEIIADKLSFTAPSVPLDVSEGGSIYQSSFHYQKNFL